MHDRVEMCVIDVCKDTENLLVYRLDRGQKLITELTTGFGREQLLFVDAIIDPGQDIVNVLTRWKSHLFPILVEPSIVESWSGTHARTRRRVA